jgi:hypothetical protein
VVDVDGKNTEVRLGTFATRKKKDIQRRPTADVIQPDETIGLGCWPESHSQNSHYSHNAGQHPQGQ